jgi:hypothetical protein
MDKIRIELTGKQMDQLQPMFEKLLDDAVATGKLGRITAQLFDSGYMRVGYLSPDTPEAIKGDNKTAMED